MPGFGPASSGTSPNIRQTLRTELPSCRTRAWRGRVTGFQELLEFTLQRENSFLNVGRSTELLRCQIFNGVHNNRIMANDTESDTSLIKDGVSKPSPHYHLLVQFERSRS
jgi:hypothetical protein